MNFQGIYHRPKSNYCYAYDKDTVHIRLRASKGDLENVILVYGDKYIWSQNREIEMKLECSDKYFDYFIAEIKPPYRRLAYYFILEGKSERYYYTEWGFFDEIDKDEVYMHFFEYPFLNKIDIHKVSEWVKDAVFYQIFPERFYNGDKFNDPKGVEKWGEAPKSDNFFGGDLKGIIDKLDYLTDLGINAIYLTPIFESYSNHKYNTKDYMKIDPHFGDLNTMKELVQKCHERGIKVVLDAVFNHIGYYSAQFQDVVKKGKKSPYYDWFYIREWPIETDPPNYYTFAFAPYMPKLNTENPEVKEYLLNVAKYWIEEADIDGWRLDVANEIDHSFWREFRKVVKKTKSDAYIVGEIWHDSLPWLLGDQFDAVMNYPFTRVCIQYFAHRNLNNKEFKELINETQIRNTQQVNEVMLNLLDSHDTSRFLYKAKGDKESLKLASVFQLTYLGAPCIYYGTEIGMNGGDDPDCRRTMEWNEDKWNKDLLNHYKRLIKIRNEHEALRRGNFKWIEGLDDVVGFVRETDKEEIIVLINNSNQDKEIQLKVNGTEYIDLVKDKKINCDRVLKTTITKGNFEILLNIK
ncbi:glycoside hydrolase family 13 protein [Caldisalinibacter kiritimatiensis]|uniref:Neopullulanase n=1 Tax=Caldisalinibacter kiritimatiensis TaxID=1304284 RepID=R1AVV0_9FIRM|nr:glycoside hydrolase family 13 protein [Caldisalinibacter kiritimatiensis]EOD00782.1 Neopullulanase [Caldisalinibacter kiritimatiensis]